MLQNALPSMLLHFALNIDLLMPFFFFFKASNFVYNGMCYLTFIFYKRKTCWRVRHYNIYFVY